MLLRRRAEGGAAVGAELLPVHEWGHPMAWGQPMAGQGHGAANLGEGVTPHESQQLMHQGCQSQLSS